MRQQSMGTMAKAGGADQEPGGSAVRRKKMYSKVELADRGAVAVLSPEVYRLITSALTDMFFLGSAMFAELGKVARAFEMETFAEGAAMMEEGHEGDRMYVIERGMVQVFKKEDKVVGTTGARSTPRPSACVGTAGPGDIVGELALLYGELRAATVVAQAGGVVAWSLTRDRFKSLAAVADAQELSMRAVNLRAVPTFSKLSRRQVYLLARAMKKRRVPADQELASRDQPMDSCFLVERGEIVVEMVSSGNDEDGKVGLNDLVATLFPNGTETQDVTVTETAVVCGPRTLVGVSVLLTAAKAETAEEERAKRMSKNISTTMVPPVVMLNRLAAKLPASVRIVASEAGVSGSTLSVSQFVAQLGSVRRALDGDTGDDRAESVRNLTDMTTYVGIDAATADDAAADAAASLGRPPLHTLADFDVADLVGEGTYGAVWRATAKQMPHGVFALKQMLKKRVVSKNQLAHVHDERRLLAKVRHPNVVKLHGAFQDECCIYLVMELVDGPDLWSVVYEPQVVGFSTYADRLCDAPDSIIRFYLACILLALSKLHELGIVYRDLKPENLMLSRRGYLKLVDFGFAKQLPYYTPRKDGEASNKNKNKNNNDDDDDDDDDAVVESGDASSHSSPQRRSRASTDLEAHFKTYTMCGTSEYLPPEIINGSGHDWSADVWAAACIFFELFAGMTPFVEFEGETDNARIFKRVLASQFKPFIPPFRIAKRKHVASLILSMLKFDPSERPTMHALAHHKFFGNFDFNAVSDETYVPDWAPAPPPLRTDTAAHFDNHPIEKYDGDQSLFNSFDW